MRNIMPVGRVLPVLFVLSVGCSPAIAPVSITSADNCLRCRRPISEVRLGAQLVDDNLRAYKFRTVSCLATYLVERQETPREVFVTDYASGKLVRARTASFVEVVVDAKTLARDYRAFQQREDADAHAVEHGSERVDWSTVMTRAAARSVAQRS